MGGDTSQKTSFHFASQSNPGQVNAPPSTSGWTFSGSTTPSARGSAFTNGFGWTFDGSSRPSVGGSGPTISTGGSLGSVGAGGKKSIIGQGEDETGFRVASDDELPDANDYVEGQDDVDSCKHRQTFLSKIPQDIADKTVQIELAHHCTYMRSGDGTVYSFGAEHAMMGRDNNDGSNAFACKPVDAVDIVDMSANGEALLLLNNDGNVLFSGALKDNDNNQCKCDISPPFLLH